MSATKAVQTLDEGCAPDASLVVATSEQCRKLRVLAAAHKLHPKLAIVCSDLQQKPEKLDLVLDRRWVKLQQGTWKQMFVAPLDKDLPEWGAQPHISDCSDSKPEQESLDTIRITLAKEFMSETDWALALRKPSSLMMSLLPAGLSIRSYGWHLVQAKEEVVIGFAKLPTDRLQSTLVRSGLKGAFFAHLGKTEDRKPVCWLPRGESNSSIEYLRVSRQQADADNVGLAYRKGGRDNLGLVGVPPHSTANAPDGSQLRTRWVAKGIPRKWSPNQVLQGLNGNKWRCIKDLTAPAKGSGVWTFSAVPPATSDTNCFILQLGEDANIIITPWRRAAVKPSTLSLRAPSGWVTVDKIKDDDDDDVDEKQPKPPEGRLPATVATELPATVLDTGSTQCDAQMNGESQANQGIKRTSDSPQKDYNKPKTKLAKVDAPAATSSSPNGPSLTTTGPDGVLAWDLGGHGDCGFRCIGAIQATRNKASVQQVEAKVSTLAISLRAKAVAWLRDNQGWLDAWAIDRDATVRSEGGKIPSNVPEYLDAAARPNKWLDHYLALACSRVINSEVMVWKFVGGKWIFLEHLTPPSAKRSKHPVYLFLKHGHFTTLLPGVQPPHKWEHLKGGDAKVSYMGGAADEELDASSEVSNWLQPSSERAKDATPGDDLGSEVSWWLKPPRINPEDEPDPAEDSLPQDCGASQASVSRWLRPVPRSLASASSEVSTCAQTASRRCFAASDCERAEPRSSAPKRLRTAQTSPLMRLEDKNAQNAKAMLGMLRSQAPIPPRRRLSGKQQGFLTLGYNRCAEPGCRSHQGEAAVPSVEAGPVAPASQQQTGVWPCPVCNLVIKAKDSSTLAHKKRYHLETRHPNFDVKLALKVNKGAVYEFSYQIPPEQAAVECPICHKRLPELSRQDYLRSVRAHCASAHPGQTPRSLFHKRITGRKKKTDGVSKRQLAAHEATRKKLYRTHDIFNILPTENSKAERGRVLYCRNCLAHVQKEAPDIRKLTCKQRLQRLRSNPWTRMMKRTWWTRLKAAQPKHAEEFLRLSGWSQTELEDLLGLNCPTPRMLQFAKEREAKRSAAPKARSRAQLTP